MSDDEHTGADGGSGPTDVDERSPAGDGNEAAEAAPDTGNEAGSRNVERYVRYALVAGLTLVALVALVRFYFAASNTIDTWVTDEYRSLFQAAFNLVVLLLAGVGISWQVRRLA